MGSSPRRSGSWWGPRPVRCADAEVDLRVGGRYRIVNELPSGARIEIAGEFVVVDVPQRLAYTWSVSPGGDGRELVTVRFERLDRATTEVIVTHERISDSRARDSHQGGWNGCLDGLALHFSGASGRINRG